MDFNEIIKMVTDLAEMPEEKFHECEKYVDDEHITVGAKMFLEIVLDLAREKRKAVAGC